MAAEFTHLHLHTDYSLLDGACDVDKLAKHLQKIGQASAAMTDHGNIYGAVHFFDAMEKKGLHPILGCELYVCKEEDHRREFADPDAKYNHMLVLAENEEGYKNLVRLTSEAALHGFYKKPRVSKNFLAKHTKGLIGFSGCLAGEVSQHIMAGDYEAAKKAAGFYEEMFGRGNYFLEIQDHGLPPDKAVTEAMFRLEKDLDIPLIATNDSHYIANDDSRAHEILLCVQTADSMNNPKRFHFDTNEFYIKTAEEMARLFPDNPSVISGTMQFPERCKLEMKKVEDPFPAFDVPLGQTLDSYFEVVCREGWKHRRETTVAHLEGRGILRKSLAEYEERLNREIDCIKQMKFPGYFMIVWDFIRYAREQNIPVGPGRGSAAGSLVAFVLGITDIDPLQNDLLFERFLNPERISMPDIDIDFCMNRRGEVIEYVTEKYGREQVAQIITFNTLAARAAIKDVGRVLELSFADVDKITKLVPTTLGIKLKDAIEQEPGFKELAAKDPRVKEVLDVALRLEGFARSSSVHAAGVVISPEPLKTLVPLARTNREEVVTQYDMSGIEKLQLLKMDFLGLTTLTLIDDALKMIGRRHGVTVVIEDLAVEDPLAYEVFRKGFTSGVFQFESPGMRDILRRYQPSRIEDLTALNALYRPGLIQGGMLDDFIERKHGRKAVIYDLPELKELLGETFGIILYQEQVMQISNRVAGYSLGDADMLRRAMGKKKAEEMAQQRERFLKGADERGHPAKKAEKIFDLMEQFAGYGFNKSHSAAYAFLAFVTAWLKAHYPVDFMAALLTSETGNVAKVVKYINECREMNIRVLPPDVNLSDLTFTPVRDERGDAIRFGLGAVKNVGEGAVEAIVKARAAVTRFKSLHHFCEHADMTAINRRVIESLVKAGALDSFEGTRAQLLLALDGAIESGTRAARDRDSGQVGLFGEFLPEEHPEPPLPKANDWTAREKLQGEKETIGFYVSGHPLDSYEEKICELATFDSSTLEGLEKGAEVALCGILTGIQRRRNREGKPWASMAIEDRLGTIDGMVFTTSYEGIAPLLQEDQAVLIRGSALPEEGNPTKVSIKEIVPLDVARVPLPTLIGIKVFVGRNGIDRVSELQTLFARKPGATQVRLRLEALKDFSVILDIPAKVRPDKEFRGEIARICGSGMMEELSN